VFQFRGRGGKRLELRSRDSRGGCPHMSISQSSLIGL
jgi:hypothetical protein